jgi:hypothetical protein
MRRDSRRRRDVGGLVGGNPRCKREKRDSDNLPGLGGLLCRDGLGLAVDSKPLVMESCGASIPNGWSRLFEAPGRPFGVVGIALGIAWPDPGNGVG